MTQFRVPELAGFQWQQSVTDQVTAPTGSETKGIRYIVIATASGVFVGHTKSIATAKITNPVLETDWYFDVPFEGCICWVDDENAYYVYDGSTWFCYFNQPVLTTSSPIFAGLTITGSGIVLPDGGTIGMAASPYLKFTDTGDYLDLYGNFRLTGDISKSTLLKITSQQQNVLAVLNTDVGEYAQIFFGQDMSANNCTSFGFYSESAGSVNNYGYLQNYGDAPGSGIVIADGGLIGIATAIPLFNLHITGSVGISSIKSGATQVAADAAANEIWKTAGHATLPNNVLMIGV